MTDAHTGADEGIRLLCVPISEPFARASAEILCTFRELADKALAAPDELDPNGVFCREAAALATLPDGQQKEARQGLHSLAVDGGQLIWVHAVDHIRALEHDILMQPPPVWSPLTLARVVLEGCSFTHYLYDPAIPLAQRLARVSGLCVSEANNEARAAASFGPEEQAAARARQAEAQKLVREANALERRNDRRNRVIGYTVDGEEAPLDHKIGAQAKAFLPDWAADAYPLLSGAAHGRPWMIARARSEGGWAGEAATVMAAVMTVMGAVESGIKAWGDYFGADVSGALEEMATARTAFLYKGIALAHANDQ
ncbi:hypothetical protein OG426_25930 [Streptomyces canus]|uniref:hypothetical protein n=1 Tax=Streptomyces canus TaxID=58343 RepID=UPI0038682C5B|nr:hypothetical protein OG426_25930 [Streptomyces canus]